MILLTKMSDLGYNKHNYVSWKFIKTPQRVLKKTYADISAYCCPKLSVSSVTYIKNTALPILGEQLFFNPLKTVRSIDVLQR